MNHRPAAILRQAIVDAGHCSLPSSSSAWPAQIPMMDDEPDNAIGIADTAGTFDGKSMDGVSHFHEGFQITLRSRDYNAVGAKADDIAAAISAFLYQAVTISGSDYLIEAVTLSTHLTISARRRMHRGISLRSMGGFQ